MTYRDRGLAYVFHPDGESFRAKTDLVALNLGDGHSVCKHAHKTPNAALTCARKKRAELRRSR